MEVKGRRYGGLPCVLCVVCMSECACMCFVYFNPFLDFTVQDLALVPSCRSGDTFFFLMLFACVSLAVVTSNPQIPSVPNNNRHFFFTHITCG